MNRDTLIIIVIAAAIALVFFIAVVKMTTALPQKQKTVPPPPPPVPASRMGRRVRLRTVGLVGLCYAPAVSIALKAGFDGGFQVRAAVVGAVGFLALYVVLILIPGRKESLPSELIASLSGGLLGSLALGYLYTFLAFGIPFEIDTRWIIGGLGAVLTLLSFVVADTQPASPAKQPAAGD